MERCCDISVLLMHFVCQTDGKVTGWGSNFSSAIYFQLHGKRYRNRLCTGWQRSCVGICHGQIVFFCHVTELSGL